MVVDCGQRLVQLKERQVADKPNNSVCALAITAAACRQKLIQLKVRQTADEPLDACNSHNVDTMHVTVAGGS